MRVLTRPSCHFRHLLQVVCLGGGGGAHAPPGYAPIGILSVVSMHQNITQNITELFFFKKIPLSQCLGYVMDGLMDE